MARARPILACAALAGALLVGLHIATRETPRRAATVPERAAPIVREPTVAGAVPVTAEPTSAPAFLEPPSSSGPEAEGPSEPARSSVVAPQPTGAEEGPLLVEVLPGVSELRGTVTVIEWNGAVTLDASGEITFRLSCDEATAPLTVPFVAGAFRTLLDPDRGCRALEVRTLTIADRPAQIADPQFKVSIPRGRDLQVRVTLPRPTLLIVVDGESGAELEDVALAPAAPKPIPGSEHPGSSAKARITTQGLESPLILDGHLARMVAAGAFEPPHRLRAWRAGQRDTRPMDPPSAAILVGAKGYAWARLELDSRRSYEHKVALEPGAELAVHMAGVDPALGAGVRLYGRDARMPYSMEDVFSDGVLEFSGLRPGSYRVAAELGKLGDVRAVLAEATVVLQPGRPTQVELFCVTPALDLVADAAGWMRVPRPWGRRDLTVALRPLGTGASAAGNRHPARTQMGFVENNAFDTFAWAMPELAVGRYELSVLEPPFQVLLELPASGVADLRHELPPPVAVHVTVLDAVRGEPHPEQRVSWRPAPPANLPPLPWIVASAEPESGALRLRVPAGSIELSLELEGFLPSVETRTLPAQIAAHEHTLRLYPRTALALHPVCEGKPIELPANWQPTLTPASTSARTLAADPAPRERHFFVSEPGLYAITFPALTGFRPAAPRSAEVLPGKTCELVVELERE